MRRTLLDSLKVKGSSRWRGDCPVMSYCRIFQTRILFSLCLRSSTARTIAANVIRLESLRRVWSARCHFGLSSSGPQCRRLCHGLERFSVSLAPTSLRAVLHCKNHRALQVTPTPIFSPARHRWLAALPGYPGQLFLYILPKGPRWAHQALRWMLQSHVWAGVEALADCAC